MENKSKFDYEIESFKKAFADKKKLRIAIYGTGRMTATLLGQIKDYNFVGLLDRDSSMIGSMMYGLRIIDREEAENNADILIINTSETYWETIYDRIKDWNITVYYRNGERAEKKARKTTDDNPYWNKSYNELRNMAEQYDIISFDIFDTLVMRKVYFPIDVFKLVENKMVNRGRDIRGFVEIRKKTASLLEEPTIDEIYDRMPELVEWKKEVLLEVKQCEIETDLALLVPRKDMVKLCRELMKIRKVYFVSDMYYSVDILMKMLRTMGIDIHSEQMIVSSDKGMDKETGKLWSYYADKIVKDKKALHIGDNWKSDYLMPRNYGISSYYVMSAGKMLENSSLSTITPMIQTLFDSMVMGLISSQIFNSPFALNSTKGKVAFEDNNIAGYCLLGSIAYSFFYWLLQNCKQKSINKVFFFAREGYLLIEEYRYMCAFLNERLPEAAYLEISRRAIMNASVNNERDLYKIARFPYSGDLQGFLKDRFEVALDEKNNILEFAQFQVNEKALKDVLSPYLNEIYQNIKKEKKNYIEYLDKVSLTDSDSLDDIAIVDSWFYGNTQYYLGKLLNKKLNGFYLCACLDESNECLQEQDMFGCFQKDDDRFGKNVNLMKYANFVEAFFTSPEGMLLYINDDGDPVYGIKMSNQYHFDIRRQMQKGILEFIRDMISLQEGKKLEELCSNASFSDALFGCMMDNGFISSTDMKVGFYYDNGLLNRKEVPIWE